MPLPLTDPVPLRTTAVWPKFAKPEPLPVVYGRCTVPTIQFDQTRKLWLATDHAIAGVDAVYRDGKPDKGYAWRNTVDPTGRAVALVELAEPLSANATLTASVRGKTHPISGALLENPADVLQDILRLAGYSISDLGMGYFRALCGELRVAGVLSSGLTLRAQLAELAESAGMLWSLAMPGFGRRWPLETRPEGEPIYARFAERDLIDVKADCRHERIHTGVRVEYDWDWAKNSARQSVTLEADTAALYGVRETTLAAKWLTDAAAALARGTEWLRARARPRWSLSFETSLEPSVAPGGWFEASHPLLPTNGELLALETEWDWVNQRQRLSAERSVGPVPAVRIVGVGGLFAQPESGLRVTYAAGVATLVIADPNDAPIRDAVVTFDSQKGRTDRTGTVRFKTSRGAHQVTVEAFGFAPVQMGITL